ncbi:GPW/gp25 family protein [Pyxidicoccus sp. 3LFB2]
MSDAFLGQGWRFPVALDASGRIAMSSGQEKIHQSLQLILYTAQGERVMTPDFGCSLHERVFTQVEGATMGQLIDDVTQALSLWEPRVDVLGVEAEPSQEDPARLLIRVDYAVRGTNSRFNLVFPFYVS